MGKKLCLDGAVAPVASQPAELPVELVCLILSVLFVDDVGNKNSNISAVSRMWRDATGLLAATWAQDHPPNHSNARVSLCGHAARWQYDA